MRHAFESAGNVAREYFPTPNSAIVAIARPIQAQTNHPLLPRLALRHNRGDVRTMMLYAYFFGAGNARAYAVDAY